MDLEDQVQRPEKCPWGTVAKQSAFPVLSGDKLRPNFPKRKIFGITNDSPEDIEKRREELERYFNEIFTTK